MKTLRLALAALGFAAFGCGGPGTGEGAEAPDITVESLATKQDVKLSSFKGKVVILDFWATWCGPCIRSMPELDRLARQYKDQGLVTMAVSDEPRDTVAAFDKRMKFDLTYYRDPFGLANTKYDITGIPATFVIDKAGKIAYAGKPPEPEALRAAVETALKG